MRIQKFLHKNWMHVVLWGGLLIYLVFAQDLYARFLLKHGRPVLVNAPLPMSSNQIMGYIDLFEPIVIEGQNVYSLVGWVFSTADPTLRPEDYERQIVLISAERIYYFPMESYPRPDVQVAFQSLGMELTNAGFHAQISQEAIAPGIYQIGFVFHPVHNGSAHYSSLEKFLICTPNRLLINDAPVPPAADK